MDEFTEKHDLRFDRLNNWAQRFHSEKAAASPEKLTFEPVIQNPDPKKNAKRRLRFQGRRGCGKGEGGMFYFHHGDTFFVGVFDRELEVLPFEHGSRFGQITS
jgi:hypothetical protein